MKIRLPKKVRIGYRTYDISELSKKQAEADDAFGWHFGARSEIMVLIDGQKPAEIANTLLHEIIHGCYAIGNIGDGTSEETTTTVLANQLTQVWRDNPEVIDFITRCSRL